jgi:hypothetical protein
LIARYESPIKARARPRSTFLQQQAQFDCFMRGDNFERPTGAGTRDTFQQNQQLAP